MDRQAAKVAKEELGWDLACGARAFCTLGGADILSAVCFSEFGRQDVARTVADRISALRGEDEEVWTAKPPRKSEGMGFGLRSACMLHAVGRRTFCPQSGLWNSGDRMSRAR